jgi:hypothetical protein
MDWRNQLTKTPYLVLFIVLITVGVGTASALTITLGADLIEFLGILDMNFNRITNVGTPTVSTDAATKAYVDSAPGTDTLALLGCTTEQVARWDGSVWVCGKFVLKNNPITTVDSALIVGTATSIAIGTDSNPVISYYDLGNADLKVAFCKDVKCNNDKVKLTRVDTVGLVGSHTSMAIGTDNNPVISYLDETNNDLKVAVVGPVLIFE